MAINIFNYDGTSLTSVQDGSIDTSSAAIKFIGKGYDEWGKPIQENLLWILQNFAGSAEPTNPILGQLWYDTSSDPNIIKVWDGAEWVNTGGVIARNDDPGVAAPGYLWYDTNDLQLKVYDGLKWQIVGPLGSAQATGNPLNPAPPTNSAIEAIRLEDTLGGNHQCWRITVAGTNIAIISKDPEFTPIAPFSTTWPRIYPGITLSSTLNATIANNKLIADLLPATDAVTSIGSASKRVDKVFAANLQVQGTSQFNNLGSTTLPPMQFANQTAGITVPKTGSIEFINGSFYFTNRAIDGSPVRQSPIFEADSTTNNRLYVSTAGSDANDGKTPGKSLASIKRALELVEAGDTIFVESGDYEEYNPLVVPPYVSIVGDNLRRTVIRPRHDQLDLFHVDVGTYFYGMTFKDHRAPAFCFAFPCSIAQASISGGKVTSISPLYSYSGYNIASPPNVFVEPPPYGGTQAVYSAVVVNGAAFETSMTNEGSSYSSNITVTLSGGSPSIAAQFRARVKDGKIKSIDITNPGSGYSFPTGVPQTLTIVDNLGSGSGAVVTVTLANGVVQRYTAVNQGSGYTRAPWVSVKPPSPVFSTSSPYVQNCSSITGPFDVNGKLITLYPPYDLTTPGVGYAAVDPEGAGGGIRIDGEVCKYDTVIRSFVADSFTQLNQGGIGHLIINRGYAQFVSCFTTFSSVGYWARSGGFANISNSVIDFGDIGLRAEGYYPNSYESGTLTNTFSSTVGAVVLSSGGQGYQANQQFAVTFTGGGGSGAAATAFIDGAGEINNVTIDNPGSNYTSPPTINWSAGDSLRANPAVPVTRPTGVVQLASPPTIKVDSSTFGGGVRPKNSSTMLFNGVFYTVISAAEFTPGTWEVELYPAVPSGTAGAAVNFYDMSNLSTGGLALEYVGSGVTYNALPFYGGIPDTLKQVQDRNSPSPVGPACDPGVVYYVTIDNTGNFKIGNLFSVNFADGSVSISSDNFNLTGLSGIGPFKRNGVIVGTKSDEISNDPSLTHLTNPSYDNTTIVTQYAARNYLTQISTDVLPDATATRDLGSSSFRWDAIYAQTMNLSGAVSAASATFSGAATAQTVTATASVTTPKVLGGAAASSRLVLQSTSGTGSTDGIDFKVGNNGATTAMNINNAGYVTIGSRLYFSDGTYFDTATINRDIPSGTVMLFAQAAAPTGWTKLTTHDNKALRVVSGTGGGSGGSVDFTTAFASKSVTGTVGATTLTEDQIPSHFHFTVRDDINGGTLNSTNSVARQYFSSGASNNYFLVAGSDATNFISRSSSVGGGDSHDHTFTGTSINLAVSYVDVILAQRN